MNLLDFPALEPFLHYGNMTRIERRWRLNCLEILGLCATFMEEHPEVRSIEVHMEPYSEIRLRPLSDVPGGSVTTQVIMGRKMSDAMKTLVSKVTNLIDQADTVHKPPINSVLSNWILARNGRPGGLRFQREQLATTHLREALGPMAFAGWEQWNMHSAVVEQGASAPVRTRARL